MREEINKIEALTRFVKDIRNNLKPNQRNETTWLMYECVNELFDSDLEYFGVDIVDLAEIVREEIINHPYGSKKDQIH
jgi:hypothetical protein